MSNDGNAMTRNNGSTEPNHGETITIYSDYVCPFCYISRRSLAQYQETRDRDLAIEWRPFDLRSHKRGPDGEIDHSVEDGKDEEYFEQVRENVTRLKEKYDADEMLDFDDLPEDIDSYKGQLASLYVDEEYPDQWLAFDEALFEALWVNGRDVGDRDVLAAIADSVGLDGEEITAAVDDESVREQLDAAFQAAQNERITGVPTFLYREHTARGAVPPEHLARLVEGA
ncbi:MAG: putative DsbA family dithiol-disulfide isomerase [Haloarculaceae archaeon]|jgi:predicted DsbA family dithiol-disulfide isomerase